VELRLIFGSHPLNKWAPLLSLKSAKLPAEKLQKHGPLRPLLLS
jgi:hypothetical protein